MKKSADAAALTGPTSRTSSSAIATVTAATATAVASLDAGLDLVLHRIRNEYTEMPGLCLTFAQAQRFWQLSATECEALLLALVECGFLVRTHKGAFVRAGCGRAGA